MSERSAVREERKRRTVPDCSSFQAAKDAMRGLEKEAVELNPYRDEPPQMKSAATGKTGYLRLDFRRDENMGRTVLADLDRRVPLLAQKALYWEESQPDMACVITIAATGCVVQGDRMALDIRAEEGAHALVTTQCATKVHVMDHNHALQLQRFRLEKDSWLEYVPDPLILHRHARYMQDTWVTLPESACFIYGEILMPGRRWHHEEELFGFDLYSAGFHVCRKDGEAPLFEERLVLEPDRENFCSAGVMNEFEVFGSMFALVPEQVASGIGSAMGSCVGRDIAWGTLKLPEGAGIALRVLGHTVESVRRKTREFHSLAREEGLGKPLPPEFLWR